MFLVNDITTFIDWFIGLMILGVSNAFNILDSITLHGFSLLDISLAVILISLGITLFINVVHVTGTQARADVGSRFRK